MFVKMEDDLNFDKKGRGPQFYGKWKTNLILKYVEDDINLLIFFFMEEK
jgi:hypothetical protein